MAHCYDCQVDFKDLEVAFTAVVAENNISDAKQSSSEKRLGEQRKNSRLSSSTNGPGDSSTRNSSFSLRRFASRIFNPGSWRSIQRTMSTAIEEGRCELAIKHDGKRAKLLAADGNLIDTMCVDARFSTDVNQVVGGRGDILMVCCEGNCGFYEIGNMTVALSAGYSALGWNVPGFGCSTGTPEPVQIRKAMETVMQYALKILKFSESDIVLFAYSIGGYPATWAATKYPNIRGLFLDACFDELLPLVKLHLDGKLNTLMEMILKNQEFNLNVAGLLERYHGPVTIVRRDRDDIVGRAQATGYVNHTNRLLKRLLTFRYPDIVNEETFPVLEEWLNLYDSTQDHFLDQYNVKCPRCPAFIEAYLCDHRQPERIFPACLGKSWDLNTREHVTLYLANKHLRTFSGNHVSYLPLRLLELPWVSSQP